LTSGRACVTPLRWPKGRSSNPNPSRRRHDRIASLAAALAAAALLAACGPTLGWSKKGLHPSAWSIDEDNCTWEATHEL
jgi:hypothetical protein